MSPMISPTALPTDMVGEIDSFIPKCTHCRAPWVDLCLYRTIFRITSVMVEDLYTGDCEGVEESMDLYAFLPDNMDIPIGYDIRYRSTLSNRISFSIVRVGPSFSYIKIYASHTGLCAVCDGVLAKLFDFYMFIFMETMMNTSCDYFTTHLVCRTRHEIGRPTVPIVGYIWEIPDIRFTRSFFSAFHDSVDAIESPHPTDTCSIIMDGHACDYFPKVFALWEGFVCGDYDSGSDFCNDDCLCEDCCASGYSEFDDDGDTESEVDGEDQPEEEDDIV